MLRCHTVETPVAWLTAFTLNQFKQQTAFVEETNVLLTESGFIFIWNIEGSKTFFPEGQAAHRYGIDGNPGLT
ncbi:hypothetical protein D3C74_415760 [compost metagenome]